MSIGKNQMKIIAALLVTVSALAGCSIPTTGVVPQNDGLFTITRQGNGFWVQPGTLTAQARQDAAVHCDGQKKTLKVVHVKEIPAGAFGRWPESEVLYQCL